MKWYQAEQESVNIRRDNSKLNLQFEFLKSDFQVILNEQSIIRDVNCMAINLKDPKGESANYARIYWNRFSGEVFIDVLFLPVPPSGKEFHLWYYDMGKPNDAGKFNVNYDKQLQKMVSVIVADHWVISLEPEGGSSEPTKESIILRSYQ